MAKKKNFRIYTLGCKVNRYDSRELASILLASGFFDETKTNVDLAIVNSCAVTERAVRKSRRTLVRARRENPAAEIILIGCWPKTESEAKPKNADLVIDEKEAKKIAAGIVDFFGLKDKKSRSSASKKPESKFSSERGRCFLKIQDGCEQLCSYCIIPYARGVSKSRSESEVLAEAKKAWAAGCGEIVLCGIHLGFYGRERGSDLVSLIRKILKIRAGDKNFYPRSENKNSHLPASRIRLSSIEITEVSEELIKLIAKSKGKFCRHLHIPLQSGSDRILKLMRRPYSADFFRRRVKAIRKLTPDIALTTDIIVGFPGESAKDFNDTFDFAREMKFSRLHVFPFSPRAGTPAAEMPGAVKKEVALERAEALRALGREMERKYRRQFAGKELEIVAENCKDGKTIGKSEFYFDVEVKGEIPAGKIFKLKMK